MNWQTVRLDEIFEIARGGSPRPIDAFITDAADGINWISIKDATKSGKYISKTKLKIRPEGLKKSRLVHPGDFLLTNSMSFGRPYIMNTTGCIHDGWLVLSGDKKRVDEEYFYYLLGSELLHRKFSSLASGAVVKNLNINLVKGVEIPLPPLAEQKQIAAILDAADSLRQKDQQLVEHYTALSQSLFLEMFGDPISNPMQWEISSLKPLTTKIGSGATPKGGKSAYQNDGVSLIRSLNIHDNRFLMKDLAHIDDEQASGLSNVIVEKQDVLLNITGASVCRCAIAPLDVLPARVNQHVCIIRADKTKLNPSYLLHLIISVPFKQKILALAGAGGATREALTKKDLEGLNILVPPIELQNQFANRVAIIEQQKQQAQTNLEKSEALFNSLLQRAFTGELTADKAA